MPEKNDRHIRIRVSDVLPYLQYIRNYLVPAIAVREVAKTLSGAVATMIVSNDTQPIGVTGLRESLVAGGVIAEAMQYLYESPGLRITRRIPVEDIDPVTVAGREYALFARHSLITGQSTDAGFCLADPGFLRFSIVPGSEIGGDNNFLIFVKGGFIVAL